MDEKRSRTCIPPLEPDCLEGLREAGIETSLLDELLASMTDAGKLVDRIPGSAQVRFPTAQPAPEPLTEEFVLAHWKEVAGRLSLAQLSADRTLRDLVTAFVGALQTRNTVSACLCARAAIENAASYDSLSRFLIGRSEKIEAVVLPYFKKGLRPDDLATLYDRPLVDELVRFCHGARLWPTGDRPNSVTEWKAWRKHSRYEPEQVAQNRGDEQSTAGRLLDALKLDQRNILSSLEKVAKRNRNMAVLGLYDMLSEFCHPNADNRSIGTKAYDLVGGIAVVDVVGPGSWTPGTIKGTWLGMIGIVEAIDIHLGAHNAIFDDKQKLWTHLALLSMQQGRSGVESA